MNKFIIRLTHDKKVMIVIVYADTEQTAKRLVMKYEGCSENRIEVMTTQNKI